MKPNVTTDLQARCLRLLKQADGPIVAALIAEMLGLDGPHESRRRRVRLIVQQLRDAGEMIVADSHQGYCLTDDERVFKAYLDGRQIEAKGVLGQTHSRKKMLTDGRGQGVLFPQRVPAGCATAGAI
jgi:biotin operon repressor